MATPEQRSRNLQPLRPGRNLLVKTGSTALPANGLSWENAGKTIEDALDLAISADDAMGADAIHIAPGDYDEVLTITRNLRGLEMHAAGPMGSVSIAPQDEDSDGLIVHADDVSLDAIGVAATGTGTALTVTGRRFTAARAKLEAAQDTVGMETGTALLIGPGTVAEIDADSKGKGDFARFEDCELAYADKAVVLQGTDRGASGQHRFLRCESHNIKTAHFAEAVGSGGGADLTFRDLRLLGHMFGPNEDSDHPVNYVLLNGHANNNGRVMGGYVPVAEDVGANPGQSLVSANLAWLGVHHPAGLSTGQPS